ncbi:AraC family transcriptional regulator [Amycolatopsis sp. H20-H5]|uniref:AraC family transcriptional regulator n=1 Tax=Amycolatopsis sp. H20-H5 TaxID=3046309 RepID=UPI002DBB42F9|nr:AraC family transcriptional regulator [Amycolatopsis sp. H20-H5]MEC3976945.1 AraC family transcriptional regulator [Amycolatopsis sp. H20-H5]
MDEIVRRAVERAIWTMTEKLGEQLTIDDMARSAMFSKFHFSRVFQHATGVSPGRFLSAMRLAEAKRLLLSTKISVADISHRVGYNSVGTFSTRFSSRVGVSPTAYRQFRGLVPGISTSSPQSRSTLSTVVRGRVHAPDGDVGPVFVGLFPSRIPEGRPVRYTVLEAPGAYVLPDVPEGSWHLLAHCANTDAAGLGGGWDHPRYVGCEGPLVVQPSVVARLVDIGLRPVRAFDPPVLLALPDPRGGSARLLAG